MMMAWNLVPELFAFVQMFQLGHLEFPGNYGECIRLKGVLNHERFELEIFVEEISRVQRSMFRTRSEP